MDDFVTGELKEFLSDKEPVPISLSDKHQTYTASPEYLLYTTSFHHDHWIKELIDSLRPPAGTNFIDVGCCSGFTGLTLALRGYGVTFHDFEGLGLQFVRWFSDKHSLNTRIIPYGQDLPESYDIAIALDVLEHTGNHLGFLYWISGLAKKVVITYPLLSFVPPYDNRLDEWVDDQAIRSIVESRYHLVDDYSQASRRYLIWKT